jgi:N-methylhydantoinase B
MDEQITNVSRSRRDIDPITSEVIRHGLLSIPNQIDVNITRTAFSPLIYEYKDYAVGIVDPEGRLIAQAKGGIPLFVANALGVGVRDGLEVYGRDQIAPGDVIFTNDPGTLGQHLNNVVMYTPVYAGPGQSRLFGFMAVLVHWIDIGGRNVGSSSGSGNTEIFQEGIQFRSVKLMSEGRPVREMYRMIEANTRFPRLLLGDVESQLSGCLAGRDMIVALIEKYGLDTVNAAVELMWDRSEAASRAAIRGLPDGTYCASSFLDNDSIDLDRRIPIDVIVTVAADEMTIDFSGVSDQVKGPVNSGREGGAVTAARIAFKYLVAPDEPANDGCFRPLNIVIPDGKILSATGSAPMGGYSRPLATVVDTVIKAMVPAAPRSVAAAHHGDFGIHSISGRDPRNGELFVCHGTMHGGWGASDGHDGPGPYKTQVHGDTLNIPVEVQEAMYPLCIAFQRIRPDSGGTGEFRGGLGVEKMVEALSPVNVQVFCDRTTCPPWGILGGGDGASPKVLLERAGKAPEPVFKGFFPLAAGERARVMSGGGGGYGDPRRRDPLRVARDVRLGYVTREAAFETYGVVLDDRNAVLEPETVIRREAMEG